MSNIKTVLKKEFKWIVKPKDFVHWYGVSKAASEECCGGINAALPTWKTAPDGTPEDQEQALASSPPVEGSDAAAPELLEDSPHDEKDSAILETLRSTPSLVQRWSFASAVLGTETKPDQGSVGTHPDSDGGNEKEPETIELKQEEEENKRDNKFIIGMVFAFILALLALGLLLALLLRKGGPSNNFPYSPNNETAASNETTTSNETLLEEENNVFGTTTEQEFKYDYTANTNYTVGAYYYPWYGEDFHRGQDYLRRDLIPPQRPALGEYNDSDADVITQHMEWFRQANINLLVTSWWGANKTEDLNTKNVIMEHEDVGNLKISLHYETQGRILAQTDMSVARDDIEYMCENYFDHPNYYKIDGRPVLFVYVTRVLQREGILEETILTMRSEASKCNHNLYIVGDQVFRDAPEPDDTPVPFWYFDAVTNYDVYGSSGRPDGYVGTDAVNEFYAEQQKWKDLAKLENCEYIPPVSPGFNDRSNRVDRDQPPMSRRLTRTSQEGSLFWHQLKQALPLVSPAVENMIMVNSFNEWHDDTQIEPAVSAGPVDVSTIFPEGLTGGLEYIPYGDLYLDLLGAATSKDIEDTELFDYLYL